MKTVKIELRLSDISVEPLNLVPLTESDLNEAINWYEETFGSIPEGKYSETD
jgi:hypothetical protein